MPRPVRGGRPATLSRQHSTRAGLAGAPLKRLLTRPPPARNVAGASIETDFGRIDFRLLPELAPETVRNFERLAGSGFYDGTLFHRVIPGFMIQGGDPNTKGADRGSWGTGGPGYTIKAEFSSKPHKRGVVSMARAADPDSAGSQFFIVTSDSPFLDGQYTAFGEVSGGMDAADRIANLPRDGSDCPKEEARMRRVAVSR